MIRARKSKKAKKGITYEVIIKHHGIIVYQKSGFHTLKVAKDHETEKKAELLQTGKIQKEVYRSLNSVYDEFLKFADNEYQENTVYNFRSSKKYFEKSIGKMDIRGISYKDVQNFFNERKDKGIETNKKIKKTLNATFVYAIRNEYISNNPLTYVKIKGIENPIGKEPLKMSDFLKIVEILKEHGTFLYSSYAIAIQIGFYTGLRISEILALEKDDIDLENETISVRHKLVWKGLKQQDYYISNELKSKASKSIIPLPKVLKKSLLEWYEINPFEKIVCTDNDAYLNPTSMGNVLKKITRNMGLDFHIHMLRHSYATILVNNGVELKTCQELMRHTSLDTTLSLYTHVENQRKKEAINTIFDISGVK